VKDDERQLLDELQWQVSKGRRPYVRQVVADLEINGKRAAYILEKWSRKGWYEYGVSVMAGWLTEKGISA
jgi:hypothetical protein